MVPPQKQQQQQQQRQQQQKQQPQRQPQQPTPPPPQQPTPEPQHPPPEPQQQPQPQHPQQPTQRSQSQPQASAQPSDRPQPRPQPQPQRQPPAGLVPNRATKPPPAAMVPPPATSQQAPSVRTESTESTTSRRQHQPPPQHPQSPTRAASQPTLYTATAGATPNTTTNATPPSSPQRPALRPAPQQGSTSRTSAPTTQQPPMRPTPTPALGQQPRPPPQPQQQPQPHAQAHVYVRPTQGMPTAEPIARRQSLDVSNMKPRLYPERSPPKRLPTAVRPTEPSRLSKPAAPSRTSKPTAEQARIRALRLESLCPVDGAPGRVLTGLRNLGNTCFMNSVVQCLCNTVPLATFFVQRRYRSQLNLQNPLGTGGRMTEELAELLIHMWCYRYKHVAPSWMVQMLAKCSSQFEMNQQQDCQEFCSFLLDAIHEDLNRVKRKPGYREDPPSEGVPDHILADQAWATHKSLNDSVVVDFFQGQYKSTISCRTCGYQSMTFEPFTFLSLPLPKTASRVTLTKCIREFLDPERMHGQDTWRCPRCKCHREATKQLYIWKLPPILLVHLKRFSFNGPFRDKLNTEVDFSNTLHMGEHVSGPRRPMMEDYQLYGVCNHYGTLTGGHYTAFCRNVYTQRWYSFDDAVVKLKSARATMEQTRADRQSGYLLFYTAVDFARAVPSFD
eukprot:m.225035 g.225035  ORF g.225035 m.225035 type:complete len:672 (+) comp18780_c3_seq5:116-2131(+)